MYEGKVSNTDRSHLRCLMRSIALKDKETARNCAQQICLNLRALGQGNPNEFYYLNAQGIQENKYHQMLIADRFLAIFYLDGQTVYVDYVLDLQTEYEWLNNGVY